MTKGHNNWGLGVMVAIALAFTCTTGTALQINGDGYIGSWTASGNSSEETETALLNALLDKAEGEGSITLGKDSYDYVRTSLYAPGTSLPDAVFIDRYGFNDDEEGGLTPDEVDLTGVLYVIGKYGGGQKAGLVQVWYLGDMTPGEIGSLPTDKLSHITVFTERHYGTPETGATAAMLAMGLAGLGIVRRKLI